MIEVLFAAERPDPVFSDSVPPDSERPESAHPEPRLGSSVRSKVVAGGNEIPG